MKRNVIFSLILIFLVVLVSGCKKEEVVVPENKQLTLEQFATNNKYKNVLSNIRCSALDNNNIVKSMSYNMFLLSDGYIYTTVTDKSITYANGEQCKKYSDIKISRIFGNYYYIGTDNTVYTMYNEGGLKEYSNGNYFIPLEDNTIVDLININFTDEEKLQYASSSKYQGRDYITSDYVKYIILRNDGNIYEAVYNRVNNYNKKLISFTLVNEKVIYSKNNYGSIKSFNISQTSSSYSIYSLSTSNGLYILKTFENEECKKYEDVKCEEKLVLNEGYLKYSNEIKYIDYNLILTNTNSLIPTSIFMGRKY